MVILFLVVLPLFVNLRSHETYPNQQNITYGCLLCYNTVFLKLYGDPNIRV